MNDLKKDIGDTSMVSQQQSNKYLSRISTNTNMDELDKLLDNNDSSRIKHRNASPARAKKNLINDHSNYNINYIFGCYGCKIY